MSEQRSKADAYRAYGPATKAIHAGYRPDPATGAVNAPIYASSTFAQDGVGGLRGGFEYARTGNPTRAALEAVAGRSRGRQRTDGRSARAWRPPTARCARCCGPATTSSSPTTRTAERSGSSTRCSRSGGSSTRPAALSDLDAVRAAITADDQADLGRDARPIRCCRSPTSPRSPQLASASGVKVLVDNTFASPALQQPLALGADIVLHSTTKYIGGHSDVVGGALVTNDEELDDAFAFLQNGAGAVPGPFDAYLTMRGLKTLPLRMQRHSENAARVAEFLVEHPADRDGAVSGPAEPSQSRRRRATDERVRRHGVGAAARVAARPRANSARAPRSSSSPSRSAGVESLIEHPGAMTHASTAGSQLEVPDDLVRLSVGIEDVADLLGDLEQALR